MYVHPRGWHLRSSASRLDVPSTLLSQPADVHGRALPLQLTPHPLRQLLGWLQAGQWCLAALVRSNADSCTPLPRTVQSRRSIASSRAVSAELISRSSWPRLAGTLHRGILRGLGRVPRAP